MTMREASARSSEFAFSHKNLWMSWLFLLQKHGYNLASAFYKTPQKLWSAPKTRQKQSRSLIGTIEAKCQTFMGKYIRLVYIWLMSQCFLPFCRPYWNTSTAQQVTELVCCTNTLRFHTDVQAVLSLQESACRTSYRSFSPFERWSRLPGSCCVSANRLPQFLLWASEFDPNHDFSLTWLQLSRLVLFSTQFKSLCWQQRQMQIYHRLEKNTLLMFS